MQKEEVIERISRIIYENLGYSVSIDEEIFLGEVSARRRYARIEVIRNVYIDEDDGFNKLSV